jgi:hypothetical protein
MWYNRGHENSYLYSSVNRKRTAPDPGGITFIGSLSVAPLPDFDGFCSRGTSSHDRTPAGLRRPDRAQRHPRLQCRRSRCAARRLFASPSLAHHVLGRRTPAAERSAASLSPRFWPRTQHLDLRTGCQGQLRAGDHRGADFRRKHASRPQTTENQLEAR